MRILLSLLTIFLVSCATTPTDTLKQPVEPPAAPPAAPSAPPPPPSPPPVIHSAESAGSTWSAGVTGSAGSESSTLHKMPPAPTMALPEPVGASAPVAAPMPKPPTLAIPPNTKLSEVSQTWKFASIKAPILAYRDFLPSTKKDDLKSTTPRSYVIFTHRPQKDDKDVYEAVCNHWVGDFETKAHVSSYVAEGTTYLPFYWVTTDAKAEKRTCKFDDLYGYDYSHAAAVISAIGKEALSVGPLLVLRNDRGWFVLDISKFDPVDVQRAFFIWKQQITNDKITNTKLTMVKMKEYFRTLVEAYGDTILKSVEKAS